MIPSRTLPITPTRQAVSPPTLVLRSCPRNATKVGFPTTVPAKASREVSVG